MNTDGVFSLPKSLFDKKVVVTAFNLKYESIKFEANNWNFLQLYASNGFENHENTTSCEFYPAAVPYDIKDSNKVSEWAFWWINIINMQFTYLTPKDKGIFFTTSGPISVLNVRSPSPMMYNYYFNEVKMVIEFNGTLEFLMGSVGMGKQTNGTNVVEVKCSNMTIETITRRDLNTNKTIMEFRGAMDRKCKALTNFFSFSMMTRPGTFLNFTEITFTSKKKNTLKQCPYSDYLCNNRQCAYNTSTCEVICGKCGVGYECVDGYCEEENNNNSRNGTRGVQLLFLVLYFLFVL
ncbi:hypothetical protein EIN_277720 [Entamoeba invadens IP1]|uniref:Uncharacterized protein n=1 Tax=Entamoeba invadens IP1 TaxID=370355 RepID=A0A0A1TVE3_ENTIV|nr:hypothetical protein EIN_277720 [Entamoeba invadens IP1]ELP84342.1 hypothetical protein EIN_277720 [Entamoeba invadens IP1]|eukprot:XP_004183688.1 hypothetical protein EIN_277720 [Entamoeba invadens IP1]